MNFLCRGRLVQQSITKGGIIVPCPGVLLYLCDNKLQTVTQFPFIRDLSKSFLGVPQAIFFPFPQNWMT